MRETGTSGLAGLLNDENTVIIDSRPADAYNGWKLRGEQRGGHIPGARCLPFRWSSYMDWIEILRFKGIYPHHSLVIYGYDKAENRELARLFNKAGYNDVKVYNHFTDEWVENEKLPLEKLHNYKHLVPSSWVEKIVKGEKPEYFDNDRFVICHAHYRNRDAYLRGHIPGAIDIDTLSLESPDTWNRRSPAELEQALTEHGITSDTTVILYGKFMFPDNNDPFPGSAAGDIGAIRCAFIMMYAGVKDVCVLNGGFRSWEEEGYEQAFDDVPKKPAKSFGVNIPVNPHLAVDTPEAKKILESEMSELVCVRSLSEYKGEVSGYNYIDKKGRIPGAVFADCGSDAYHMENYRNPDHTTREFGEISEIWRSNGLTPEKKLAFYCGTGWRGSEAFFNAWLMGWPNISVYDGGWFEWSSDPSNPTEKGEPVSKQS